MSRVDDLIKQYAPGGVEYKTLGAVAEVFRGKRFVKADMVDSGIPCIHYGEIYTKYGLSASTSFSFLEPARAKSLRVALPGDLVVATAGETIEDIGNAVAWLGSEPAVIHDACYAVRSAVLDATFLSYLFRTAKFKDQIRKWISSSKISSISTQNLSRALVPVPPLEVQREIVRILEAYAELEAGLRAELEAELAERRQQHAHYRDTLLSFGGRKRVRWAALSEVGTLYGGLTGKSKADFTDGNAPFITYMNVFSNLSTDLASNVMVKIGPNERQAAVTFGDVLFTASSETRAEVGMASAVTAEPTEPTYLNSFCFGFRPNSTDEINPEFAKHLFRARVMRDQIVKTANGVTRINISKGPFGKMLVPLPDVEEQKRIADVLDKFDALVSDLSSGLTAEIDARGQQNAHYRDRLFTFEEAVS